MSSRRHGPLWATSSVRTMYPCSHSSTPTFRAHARQPKTISCDKKISSILTRACSAPVRSKCEGGSPCIDCFCSIAPPPAKPPRSKPHQHRHQLQVFLSSSACGRRTGTTSAYEVFISVSNNFQTKCAFPMHHQRTSRRGRRSSTWTGNGV